MKTKKTIPPIPASLIGDPVCEATWTLLMNKVRTNEGRQPFQMSHPIPDDLDMEAFERYCHYKSVYVKARDDVAKHGAFLKASNGISYKNPAFAVMNMSQGHLMKLAKGISRYLDDTDLL